MSKAPVLQAFVARGLASREIARKSGRYVAAKDVLAELQSLLDAARVRHAKVPPDRQR